MIQHLRRAHARVPALATWFEGQSGAHEIDSKGAFFAARFTGRPLWILANPGRDAFLGEDLTIVARANRGSGRVEIGWTGAAHRALLVGLPRRVGFAWDGWLLIDGARDRNEISERWRDSRADGDNAVPAEASYPYGDRGSSGFRPFHSMPRNREVRTGESKAVLRE